MSTFDLVSLTLFGGFVVGYAFRVAVERLEPRWKEAYSHGFEAAKALFKKD